MLQELKVHPTIPVKDLDVAREFYEGKLGLKGEVGPAGVMYNCGGGTRLLVFPTPAGGGKSPSTAAGFQTDDLDKLVKELTAKGVVFEQYDYPQLKTNELGIAENPVGHAAWFKDPDGNTLGIVQFDKM